MVIYVAYALQNRIELTLNKTRPLHCPPNRAGPWTRGFAKTEIDKMLKIGFIEPAKLDDDLPEIVVSLNGYKGKK